MSFTIQIINDTAANVVKSYQISDVDVIAMKDSLPGGQGVLDWIETALIGKIHNCRKRMMKTWYPIYLSEKKAIPAGENAFIQDIITRNDYLDREARDRFKEEL